MFSVRGGNSGFVRNGQQFASDANSCFRKILLRHHKIEEPIDEGTKNVFAVGFFNEELFKQTLIKEDLMFMADVELYEQVTKNVSLVGHADFVVTEPLRSIVFELKSITSKNSHKNIIEKGKYKLTNLAQCVRYMLMQETPYGVLRYTSFLEAVEYRIVKSQPWSVTEEKIKAIEPVSRCFEIFINNDGDILVDGKPSSFHVDDILTHTKLAAKFLESNTVSHGRPLDPSGSDTCQYCPFSKACDTFDTTNIKTEDFIKLAMGEIS